VPKFCYDERFREPTRLRPADSGNHALAWPAKHYKLWALMRKAVAVYGGSFDPPHISHVLAAVYALKVGGFDQVLVVPVFEHALHKQLTSFEHRVRLCELSFSGITGATVSTVESGLATPSLTHRTLEHLSGLHPDWAMRLLVGSDVLGETGKWRAFERVAELAPPYIVARPGYPHPTAQAAFLPDVSSTRVRAALAEPGEPQSRAILASCLPSAVLSYITEHGLYRRQSG
jgi:nicotinate-nucleotide adenylyltransferase